MLLWLALWLRLGLWLVLWLGLELWGGAVVSTGIRISIFYADAEGVVLLCTEMQEISTAMYIPLDFYQNCHSVSWQRSRISCFLFCRFHQCILIA